MKNKLFKKEVEQLFSNKTSKPKIVTNNSIKNLPNCVQKWMVQTGIIGKPEIKKVKIKQQVSMKLKPNQKGWNYALAEQYITTDPPAFIWTVKMKFFKWFRITGRDKFENGNGEMLLKLNSLFTLGKETGEKIDRGTLQRYLAEIVWYPSFALSKFIVWEEISKFSAKAIITINKITESGVFYFDSNYNIEKFSTLRFKGKNDDKRYEWIATIKKHSNFENITVPSQMEATWKLNNKDWTWLKLKVTDIKYNN